jgi:hypothetical protein
MRKGRADGRTSEAAPGPRQGDTESQRLASPLRSSHMPLRARRSRDLRAPQRSRSQEHRKWRSLMHFTNACEHSTRRCGFVKSAEDTFKSRPSPKSIIVRAPNTNAFDSETGAVAVLRTLSGRGCVNTTGDNRAPKERPCSCWKSWELGSITTTGFSPLPLKVYKITFWGRSCACGAGSGIIGMGTQNAAEIKPFSSTAALLCPVLGL